MHMFLYCDILKNSHHKFQISQQHNFIHIRVPEFTNMATQFIHIRVPDFTNFITSSQTITGSQTPEVQHTSVQQVAKAQTRSLRPSEVETIATPHRASS
jgi:hypothetical protein